MLIWYPWLGSNSKRDLMALTVLTGLVKSGKDPTPKIAPYNYMELPTNSHNFNQRWDRAFRIRMISNARLRGMIPGARVQIAAQNELPLRIGTIIRLNTAMALDKTHPLLVVVTDGVDNGARLEQVFSAECQVISTIKAKDDE